MYGKLEGIPIMYKQYINNYVINFRLHLKSPLGINKIYFVDRKSVCGSSEWEVCRNHHSKRLDVTVGLCRAYDTWNFLTSKAFKLTRYIFILFIKYILIYCNIEIWYCGAIVIFEFAFFFCNKSYKVKKYIVFVLL